jgi:hypothetical protein
MKEVTFTIKDGQVTIEASGFKGGACDAATKAFEDILGGAVSGKKRKAEYYQQEQATLKVGR